MTEYKDVIPPPQTGDEGIEAPDPDAGHKEEVILRQARRVVNPRTSSIRYDEKLKFAKQGQD
jgi:hypothetical protein